MRLSVVPLSPPTTSSPRQNPGYLPYLSCINSSVLLTKCPTLPFHTAKQSVDTCCKVHDIHNACRREILARVNLCRQTIWKVICLFVQNDWPLHSSFLRTYRLVLLVTKSITSTRSSNLCDLQVLQFLNTPLSSVVFFVHKVFDYAIAANPTAVLK